MPDLATAIPHVQRSGAGEPLVLLHGLGSSSGSWKPVLPALSARHDVLAIDLPGFGESPSVPPEVRPTPTVLADAVERALTAADVDAAHVCGNSLGGWVALELARRGLALSVVAISPAGFWLDRERRFTNASLKLAHRQARLLRPVARPAMALPPLRFAMFGQVRRRPRRLPPEDAAHDLRMTAKVPDFPRTRQTALDGRRVDGLHDIRCPVLVLWGTEDLLLPPRQADRAARAIPGAELRMLRGLGHIPMSDEPDTVAGAILAFTARSLRTPGAPPGN